MGVLGRSKDIEGTFTDERTGSTIDPNGVSIKVKDPAGTVASYVYGVHSELVRLATGNYRLTFTPTTRSGLWHYRWESNFSTSPETYGPSESTFKIEDSAFDAF